MSLVLATAVAAAPTLREAMRNLVSGVCVVTAGASDDRTGITVTTATSVSIDPPTMLVCINRSASVWPIILRYRHFCVNILADHQRAIAERFANGTARGVARYTGGGWRELATGALALDEALAAIDCDFDREIEWHSHLVLFGSVRALRVGSGDALVYSQRQYGSYPAAPTQARACLARQ